MDTAHQTAPAEAPESGILPAAPDGRLHPLVGPLPRPSSEGWWWEWWGGQWNAWKVIKKSNWLYLLWDGELMGVQRINQPKMRSGGEWFKATLPDWPNVTDQATASEKL